MHDDSLPASSKWEDVQDEQNRLCAHKITDFCASPCVSFRIHTSIEACFLFRLSPQCWSSFDTYSLTSHYHSLTMQCPQLAQQCYNGYTYYTWYMLVSQATPFAEGGRVWSRCHNFQVVTMAETCCDQWDPHSLPLS